MMYKILILAGGYSNEREISLITAKSVIQELNKNKKYKLFLTEPDGYFVNKLRKFKPKLVLNLLHGRYGEDGYIQSILESVGLHHQYLNILPSVARRLPSLGHENRILLAIFPKSGMNPCWFLPNHLA